MTKTTIQNAEKLLARMAAFVAENTEKRHRPLRSIEMELASYKRICEANAREKVEDNLKIEKRDLLITELRCALNDFVQKIKRVPYGGPHGKVRESFDRKIKRIKRLL